MSSKTEEVVVKGIRIASFFCLFTVLFSGGDLSAERPCTRIPTVVSIELTRDFYEALRDEGLGSGRLLTSDPSIEYLRRIAVSSEFAVKTNLEILLELLRSQRCESPSGPTGSGQQAK